MPGFGFTRRQRFRAGGIANADRLTEDGVTFTLSSARPAGQYEDGSWWVLGPVSITSITPEYALHNGAYSNGVAYANREINGTMVNPGNRSYASGGLVANNAGNTQQGFDGLRASDGSFGSYSAYNADMNVDPARTGAPLVVTTGSVVKCVSDTDNAATSTLGRAAPQRFVVLTVVGSIPAAGSIRPGISGTDKTPLFNRAMFSLSPFQNLTPVAGAPSFEQALASVPGNFNTFQPDSINSANMMPKAAGAEYGREIANAVHAACLCLHLASFTSEQKIDILCGLAKLSGDVLSRATEGGVGLGAGGGNQWKKVALVLTALAAQNHVSATLLEYCNAAQRLVWAEDRLHFRIRPIDIAMPRNTADGRPRDPFTYAMLGSAEWGEVDLVNNAIAGSNWNLFYRDVVGGSLIPGILAVELANGAEALWNNPTLFTYNDTSWHRRGEFGPGNRVTAFAEAMGVAYRVPHAAPPAIVEAGVKDDNWWVRFDTGLDEGAAAPSAGDVVISVSGSPAEIGSITVWRQNLGGKLATTVNGSDVVTISYASGTNRLRSVDGVDVPNFAGQSMANLTPKVGGPNADYPVVQFGGSPASAYTMVPPLNYGAASSVLTLGLMKFTLDGLPAATMRLLGSTGGGTLPITIEIGTTGALAIRLRDAAGTTLATINSSIALIPGTEYDILLSVDLTQASSAAGISLFINGISRLGSVFGYTHQGVIGWTAPGIQNITFGGAGAFKLGAFYMDTTTWLDLTNSSNREKFSSVTAGNLDIGTLGTGINGTQPNIFLVGNADQWNSGDMSRGSGSRFFVSTGAVTNVSGSEWR